jgi:hypothetical protein
MIQRTYRGVIPPPVITAPIQLEADYHEEALRLATFRQSEETRGGRVAPFPDHLTTQH